MSVAALAEPLTGPIDGSRSNPGESVGRERQQRLRRLGIYTPDMLDKAADARASQAYLVHELIRDRSINLLVGDSNLGKTPLAIQLGLCVASCSPFLGLAVQQGAVLYCDGESDLHGFRVMVRDIAHALGLPSEPFAFHVWSPNWEDKSVSQPQWSAALGNGLRDRIEEVKPALVIVDPLRVFWNRAETKTEEAAGLIAFLRDLQRLFGCSFLISHHRRKVNQQAPPPSLVDNPRQWFQEAAGAHALVNQTDTRLGVVPHDGQGDLLLGGLVRGQGPLPPFHLYRLTNEAGDPVAYGRLTGMQLLNTTDRGVFDRLPSRFRFKDAEALFSGSGSNASRFLRKCASVDVLTKEGKDYVKVEAVNVERMECVERV